MTYLGAYFMARSLNAKVRAQPMGQRTSAPMGTCLTAVSGPNGGGYRCSNWA